MKKIALLLAGLILSGCAEVTYQQYSGAPRSNAEISTVRLWTPTTTSVFKSPGLLVEKINGIEPGPFGRVSHAYLEPGEHEFQVKYMQIKSYNLLCGALCDAIFNKPATFKASTLPGHTYTLKYINDNQGTVTLEDKGTEYDPRCLEVREFANGKNC
ncbi:hypothetical protein [Pseudomonas paralcaligenes]|uniref:hypothetical protein n=1 Tax=Pseudomonas paralcaligenes TaxID=2772558 RepID=UPI001C810968|nr:hypothetical protein [Pseudomonas paralcaligenes]